MGSDQLSSGDSYTQPLLFVVEPWYCPDVIKTVADGPTTSDLMAERSDSFPRLNLLQENHRTGLDEPLDSARGPGYLAGLCSRVVLHSPFPDNRMTD